MVSSVEVLLALVTSNSAAWAEARLVREPAAVGVTTRVTVADAPLANPPSEHVTLPPDGLQPPWLGVADTNVTPAGSTLVKSTPLAADGPALLTVTE